MGIADDLPTLADRLANPAPGDPEQACLRRAIPTAYYALFHLLVQEAVQGWSGSPATLPWAGENPRTQKHAGCVRNHLPGFGKGGAPRGFPCLPNQRMSRRRSSTCKSGATRRITTMPGPGPPMTCAAK